MLEDTQADHPSDPPIDMSAITDSKDQLKKAILNALISIEQHLEDQTGILSDINESLIRIKYDTHRS